MERHRIFARVIQADGKCVVERPRFLWNFLFCRVRDLNKLTQLMLFEFRKRAVIGSESPCPKLAGAALYHANTVPTAPMCSFQNIVVNNDANLWIITRLARANDELGAMNRMMPARWSMQAESL